MTQKTHRTIYAILNALAVVGSFEGLIAILNLNQPELFFKTAFYVGLFFILEIGLLYDLHYKTQGVLKRAYHMHRSRAAELTSGWKILSNALKERSAHFFEWASVKHALNYLIMPGMIFWGSVVVFYLSFGFPKTQQVFALLSSIAFFVTYFYLKEIFSRGKEVVDREIFIVLTVVKIYTAALVYGAVFAFVRSYCLSGWYLIFGVFALTFLLVYQALFQHRKINNKNLAVTFLISAALAIIGYVILVFWSYDFFTAAVFLTIFYNLLWGVFHYHLDQALNRWAFLEILAISLVIAGMIFSATNFKARIFDTCQYRLPLLNTKG